MMVGIGQAIQSLPLRPEYYTNETGETVAYTTTSASALPLCSEIVAEPGFVGPINCDPSSGPVQYTPAETTTPATGSTPTSPATATGMNSMVILALAGLGAVLLLGRR